MAPTHAEFWSHAARHYDDVVDRSLGPRTRELVRERLAKEGRLGNAAEFGCGTGFFTGVLAAAASHLVATDLSPAMLEQARGRVPSGNVTFAVADCQRTSFPDTAFDTVFLALVLHFTEPELVVTEMRRILRPGGLLLVANLDPTTLAGMDRFRARVRILMAGITGYRMRPPRGFGKNVLAERQLCELLQAGGFEVLGTEVVRDASRTPTSPSTTCAPARRPDDPHAAPTLMTGAPSARASEHHLDERRAGARERSAQRRELGQGQPPTRTAAPARAGDPPRALSGRGRGRAGAGAPPV